MLLQGTILILFILASFAIKATTNHSQYIEELQNKFENASSLNKIVYLDRDKLSILIAQQGSKDSRSDRAQPINKFIQSVVGHTLTSFDAETLYFRLSSPANTATPMTSQDGSKLCIVIPANPNFNQAQSIGRSLFWDQLKNKKEYSEKTIKAPLSLEVSRMISDLHETFHCLDPWFFSEVTHQESAIDPHSIHRSEVFAEVGALLYMKHLGYENINYSQAQIRTLGSYMSGKHIRPVTLSEPQPWGAIYSLQKAILKIDEAVEYELPFAWNLSDILQRSQAITQLYSLNSHEFHALSELHKNKKNLEGQIIKFRQHNHDYLRNRFLLIEKYIKKYQQDVKEASDFLLEKQPQSNALMIKTYTHDTNLNDSDICPNLDYQASKSDFAGQVSQLRQNHYEKNSQDKGLDFTSLEKVFQCFEFLKASPS